MTPAALPDEYLAPGQVALLLHVSAKTVTRWAEEGRIPCIVTLGGHRRFRRDDVEEIVEKMMRTPRTVARSTRQPEA